MLVAWLHIESEGEKRHVVLANSNSLGRHPNNSIQVLDRIVSKEHCLIDFVRGVYVLRDLGSLNGTFVNGERVVERNLRSGDEITMGTTRIVFEIDENVRESALALHAPKPHLTLAQEPIDSHIRAKLEADERAFAPESQIHDALLLRADYERLRVSYELTRAIGVEPDVYKLLEKVLDCAITLLNANRGVILLRGAGQDLEPACVRFRGGVEDSEQAGDVVVSKTILQAVMQGRVAVLSSDASVDQRFRVARSIIMQGIRATMAVPLLHSGDLFGVLFIDSNYANNAFEDKDLQLLQTIANQAALFIQNSLYARRLELESVTRQRFQRLLSPAIAEQVISGSVDLAKGGELRQVTTLFSDIRGFTAIAERKPAPQVVAMLNDYFESMVEIIFRYEGTLDKFVGDAIMALFGAPVKHTDDPLRAVKTALEMQRTLSYFNKSRLEKDEEPLCIGIGINTGEVVAGYLGSSRALEYTVIGDAVNISSRLCQLAGAGEVLISESTYEHVKNIVRVQPREPVQLKGKSGVLRTFQVLGYVESLESRDSVH